MRMMISRRTAPPSLPRRGRTEIVIIILMGVTGCGKTTVGALLAKDCGWEFYDADDFHPAENVAKMKSGTPLD